MAGKQQMLQLLNAADRELGLVQSKKSYRRGDAWKSDGALTHKYALSRKQIMALLSEIVLIAQRTIGAFHSHVLKQIKRYSIIGK